MKKIQSTCNYCAIDCNLDFYVEDGRIMKVVPTKGYPVNDGFCCIKGLSLDKQLTVKNRPLFLRSGRQTGPCGKYPGKRAFSMWLTSLQSFRKNTGQRVAGISTGQLTMEEFALFGHVMRNYLKTNVDGNTRLCMATAVVAHKQSYGFDAPGYTLKDLELSDTIILIGANPVVTHPIMWGRSKTITIRN
ncbi:MAG: molybdopterin-dependent oxidoreductase [Blautia marasmi]